MAQAQSIPPRLEVGARVRILDRSLGRYDAVGRVVELSGDTLTLLPETDRFHRQRILLSPASRIYVSIAHHNLAGRGAIYGALGGGVLGAILVSVRQEVSDFGAGFEDPSTPRQKVSNAPIFIGALAGGAAGALIGASKTVDSWVPVSSPASKWLEGSLTPDGRLRFAVGVRF